MATALITIGAYVIVRRGFLPLTNVIAEARSISGKELGYRLISPGTCDEVEDMVMTFNGLLERIERSQGQIRQFTSDAAHELRTPLATLKNQVQVSLRHPRTVEEYQGLLRSLDEDIHFLEKLLSGLLLLARLEDKGIDIEPERIFLRDFAIETVKDSPDIIIEIPQEIAIVVYKPLFARVVTNICDNTRKYGGSQLTITASSNNSETTLIFSDNGIGVPEDVLSHLFDRFYKVDTARSDRKGVGLGLSIVKAIIEYHGGRITPYHTSPHGLTLDICLPLQPHGSKIN